MSGDGPVRVRLLGPVDVVVRGAPVAVAGARRRAVLAALALRPGRVLGVDQLIDIVWAGAAPATVANTLQSHVSQLRRLLGGRDAIVARPPGYLLDLGTEPTDVATAERLIRDGTGAADPTEAVRLLGEAVRLWRGQPLADLGELDWFAEHARRLDDLWLTARQALVDARLALGQHTDVIPELTALADRYPLHEQVHRRLMLALYRSGRQAEALAAYRGLRQALAERLGLDPSPAVRDLEAAILRQDPSLDPSLDPPAGPVVAGTVAPAQLPSALRAFVGRDEELARLDAFTGEAGGPVVVAVSGTAGIGKTTLAVCWAHRARHRFPDGQLYVNLRGYDPDAGAVPPAEALRGFLLAFGVPAQRLPDDLPDLAGHYRGLVADRRVLVVLDNARDAAQVRPLLSGAPGSVTVVTSRSRLTPLVAAEGARPLVLDLPSPAEARDLLVARLGADRVAAEPAATADIIARCARLPLALAVVAARAATLPGARLADLAAELRDATDPLDALHGGDRATDVRAVFSWSYRTLAPAAARLFRLLGLVPGADIAVAAAARLAGVPVRDAAGLLDELAAAHLVDRPSHGRYACHDLLRRYAAERADAEDSAADRAAAVGRLLDWYLHTTDAAAGQLYAERLRLPLPPLTDPVPGFRTRAEARAWLAAELPNLVAVVGYAAEHGPARYAWLLADALRGYFALRLDATGWLASARAARQAAESAGVPDGVAAARLSLADLYRSQDRLDEAATEYRAALALCRATGWYDGQAAVLSNLSDVYRQTGRLAAAAEVLAQALALNRQTGRVAGQAAELGNLGLLYQDLGRLAEAERLHREALALDRAAGSRAGEGVTLVNLGGTYQALGRFPEARECLTLALRLSRESGDRVTEAEALTRLGAVQLATGQPGEALATARTAVDLARAVEDGGLEAEALLVVADVFAATEPVDVVAAADHYARATGLAERARNRRVEVAGLLGLAAADVTAGRPDRAAARATDALATAREAGYRVQEGQALTVLADAYLAAGRPGDAVDAASRALEAHRDTGHRPGLARAERLLDAARAARTGTRSGGAGSRS